MYIPPDDIDLLITQLREIRLNSYKHTDSQVRSTVPYLDRAIEILLEYTATRNRQSFIPEQRPEKYKVQKDAAQKKQNSLDLLPIEEFTQCPDGKHWVRRLLKNGEYGYCRRNPQKSKKQ